ncbi:DMT family transporter [Yangia mangrovi]|uniref:DMT family transporter n=1 Tax=Alloyangia mangrovi TaxID=1779329 RepID=A0A2A3JY46_9RHOB|nr:DMT family transporter [Alloyangia mangrovi]MCT4370406.1 DMT family transporter [Alloyangia mangrovi]
MPTQALIMLAAGIGIPVLAALNSRLGVWLGSPAAAAVILFCVALSASLIVLFSLDARPIARAVDAPKHLFLAGLFVAFYVLSVTYVAPTFGVGRAVFFVLLGQLISAAAIDHFGLFGVIATPISARRGLGLAMMAAGVFLAQR